MFNFTLFLKRASILFIFVISSSAMAQVTIDSEDFESGWGIWNDGGVDCQRGTPFAPNGNYAIELQDNSGVASSMTTNNIDLTPYSSLDFTFDYETISMESGEDFWVQYSSNGGSSWTTIGDYNSGVEFNNNTKYTPTITIDTGSYTFATNSQFRIRCDASNNGDDVYIDNVVITGYAASAPEINIIGNATNISDGDTTPSTADDTDFGNVDVTAGSNANTFTIENLGTADLILTDASPYVVISGTHAADFILTANPSTPIAASGTTTFTITFNPSALGLRTASVSIANDDSDENPYNFNIQGTGTTTLPEINIQGNATDIADGDITPTTADDTDFGNVDVTAGTNVNTFTIQNQGSSLSLNLTGASPYVVISGAHAADFTVTAIPSNSIAAGGSTTFDITFNPSAIGLRTASISIANNDTDENPYNFNIQGTGFIPPPCGTTTIHTADFETGLDGWTDGGGDAARVNNASRSYSNSWSLEIRNNDTSGNTSSFLSPLFDLSSYDKVDFKFFFTAYNHENSDNFFIEYSSDSGSTWTTVNDYVAGDISSKNGDYESTNSIIFYCKTAALLDTVHSFPAGTVSQFRVRSDASDTTDLVYIDNITINGVSYCTPTEGPGGITSDLNLWLKADHIDGVSVAADGSSVTSWYDSGKGNNAEPTTSTRAPVFKNNPTDNFNFNPVVYFDNENSTSNGDMTYLLSDRDVLQGSAGFNSNDMFVVIIPDRSVTSSMIPLDTFTGHDATGNTYSEDVTGFGYGSYTARLSGEYMAYCVGSTSSSSPYPGYGVGDTSASTDYNQIGIVNIRHNASNNGMDLYLNGTQTDDIENDTADFSTISNTRYFIGRSQYWSGSFEGRIAEIITYSATKNDATDTSERNRIQSYLGIKYGITLAPDSNGTTKDYVNSDGTVIWDQSANTGFNNDIAGIGRDDASELNQKQSSSVNYAVDGTGPTKGILTVGLTDIYNTNYDNQTSNATS
ncbi:MAG: choice-of-anchor D domain-containing protein, partial [Winogradskyella sp.]|nr:choice-of-anchor D domain-containing protein [Winogradskyella sp.]